MRRAGEPGKLDGEKADYTAAEHDGGSTGLYIGEIHAVEAAGERLAKGAVQRIEAGRQGEGLFLRQDDIVGKTAVFVDADRL